MALTLGDNFSYQGAKPLDARLVYSTVASMKAVADATMYDGCMAYCEATDKTYQWKSTNDVDETTGKWREFTSGGDTIQVSSMPTASASELGKVYQYIGSTTLVYTHGYFYECVSDGETVPTYSWTEVSVQEGGSSSVPVMRGATNYTDGKEGLAPKPFTTDVSKALFGDGQYHTIYTAASGSTILVVTTDTSLYGRTVTLSDGVNTETETMGNDGECYFTDITMFGNVTVSCTDAQDEEAHASLNLTYFGTYVCHLSKNVSIIRFTSTDLDLLGKEVTIWKGDTQVATTSLRNVSGSLVTSDVYVEETGTYTAKIASSPKGVCKTNIVVSALHETYTVELQMYHIYAFQIDENDSNPATCVSPYESEWGCENYSFTPAHMDYANDRFDMGSWTGNEFFFPKPCMLKYDGSVDYYLDPNDFTKKADGTASDVADFNYAGNCMVEFPTIYFKRWQANGNTYVCISDKKLSTDFHAYAHHDKNGDVLQYIYLAAYDGSYDGTRLRSISGAAFNTASSVSTGKVANQLTVQQEINYAVANNNNIGSTHEGYYITHKAEWDMLVDLMVLISNTTDSQTAFGKGYASANHSSGIGTGTMNDKGMFWGENAAEYGVKVFFIENIYGNIFKFCSGYLCVNQQVKVKMTYGTEDGSTATGYNLTSNGYITVNGAISSGTNNNGISKWKNGDYGIVPYEAMSDTSHYLCDSLSITTVNITGIVCTSGSFSEDTYREGIFRLTYSGDSTLKGNNRTAMLTFK